MRGAQERDTFAFEARLHRDEDLVAPHHQRRDGQALDHLIGVGAHDGAVLERARFAFGAVGDHVLRLPGGAEHALPLAPGGEPGTTPPAESGVLQLREHAVGCKRAGHLVADAAPPIDVVVHVDHGIPCEHDLGHRHGSLPSTNVYVIGNYCSVHRLCRGRDRPRVGGAKRNEVRSGDGRLRSVLRGLEPRCRSVRGPTGPTRCRRGVAGGGTQARWAHEPGRGSGRGAGRGGGPRPAPSPLRRLLGLVTRHRRPGHPGRDPRRAAGARRGAGDVLATRPGAVSSVPTSHSSGSRPATSFAVRGPSSSSRRSCGGEPRRRHPGARAGAISRSRLADR